MKLIAAKFFLVFVALCFLSYCHKVTVAPANTVSVASSTPTMCINTALTAITHTTTGATGIGTATGLPAGVTATWATNVVTISGMPTESGTFNYIIPLTGGSGAVSATGSITITSFNTVSVASSMPTLLVNTALTAITHTTTGATGIGVATGLPAGVTAAWAANVITISGTPTAIDTFYYTIPLTGGCGNVNATGMIMTGYPISDFLPLNVGAKYLYSYSASYYEIGYAFPSDEGECQWEFIDRSPTPPYVYNVRQTLNGIHVMWYENPLRSNDTTIISNRIDNLTFQENENGTVKFTFPVMYWGSGYETIERYWKSPQTEICFTQNYVLNICLSKNIGIKSFQHHIMANHSASTTYTLIKGPY